MKNFWHGTGMMSRAAEESATVLALMRKRNDNPDFKGLAV